MTSDDIRKEAEKVINGWFGSEGKDYLAKCVESFGRRCYNAGIEAAVLAGQQYLARGNYSLVSLRVSPKDYEIAERTINELRSNLWNLQLKETEEK